MPAYWIGRVIVTDEARYGEYAKLAGPAIQKHGGTFLARGGKCETFEGKHVARNVLVRFDSLEQAKACYHSPEYQEALKFAKGASDRDVCIVEGLA